MAFFSNVYTVFIQVMVLAVMVAVGFFGDRFGYFTEHAARLCNNLLFYVITPCVIVNSFLNVEYTRQSAGGFLRRLRALWCFMHWRQFLVFFYSEVVIGIKM